MAKPILVIGIPGVTLNQEQNDEMYSNLAKKVGQDYHIFIYNGNKIEEPTFQVFYEKDFNEVKYEELKQIIKERISPGKNCPQCAGTGQVQMTDIDFDPCRRCEGTGKI